MKKHFLSKFIIIPVICLLSGTSVFLHAKNTPAEINYYSGGEKAISLSPFSSTVSYYLPFKGTTRLKTVMLKIGKSGGSSRQIIIPLESNGSFNYIYLLKDGPGTYEMTVFGSNSPNSLSFSGILTFSVTTSEKTPDNMQKLYLNDKIIDFVNASMGKTIGRGECWDLAQEALDLNGADWTRPTNFGIPLNPDTDEIKPGDIIQFRSVKTTESLPGGVTRRETIGMPDHTGVIYKVIDKRHYEMADQNNNNRRFVIKSEVKLINITSGSFRIYRPVAVLIKGDQFNH